MKNILSLFFLLLFSATSKLSAQCPSPSGTSAQVISSITAVVSWDSLSCDSIKMSYSVNGSNNYLFQIIPGTSTKKLITNLDPASIYQVDFTTYCGTDSSTLLNVVSFTTLSNPVFCLNPGGLTQTVNDYNSVTLSWSQYFLADSFLITLIDLSDSSVMNFTCPNQNTFTINTLVGNTNYSWSVSPECSGQILTKGIRQASWSSFTTPQYCNAPLPQFFDIPMVSSNSALITWQPTNHGVYYEILYSELGSGSWSAATANSDSVLLTGLNENTSYEFKIRTNCGNVISTFSAPGIFTTLLSCNVPDNQLFSVSGINTSSAVLHWQAVPNADSFEVRYKAISASDWIVLSTSADSLALTGLSDSTQYEFQVRTICQFGTSDWSDSKNFLTWAICSTPDPTYTTAFSITTNSAIIRWQKISNSVLYRIRYAVSSTTNWTVIEVADTNLAISGLQENTQYKVQIRTLCSSYNSSFAPSFMFNTLQSCSIPSQASFNVTNITLTSADIRWSSVTNAVVYLFRYRVSGSGGWITTQSTTNSITLSSLIENTTYEYQVATNCSAASSNWSSLGRFTTAQACIAPVVSAFHVNSISATDATVNWDAPSNSVSFVFRYALTGTTNWITINTSNNFVVLTGLTENTTYDFQISINCTFGNSGWSDRGSFTTILLVCPSPDSNYFFVSDTTGNSAIIHWQRIDSTYNDYEIRYALAGTNTYTVIPVTGDSVLLNGLQSGALYHFEIRTNCQSGNSAWIDGGNFNTIVTCSTPDVAFFGSTNITDNSASVSWRRITDGVSYYVRYCVRYSGNWQTVTTASISANLTSLLSDTWYEFQVRTVCSDGNSYWSSSGIFKTLPPPSQIPSITRGPYLNMANETQVTVRWRTDIACDTKIEYGISSSNLSSFIIDTTRTTEHEIRIVGLSAASKYFYSVGTTNYILQKDTGNYFMTHPPVGIAAPTRIWAIGDFGRNSTAQKQVRDAYMNYDGSANTNVWLWLGDNAYDNGTDIEYTSKVFDIYPYQFKKWVVWPSTGNHDLYTADAFTQTGPYYDIFTLPKNAECGGIPSSDESYYSYDYANIHFITLESTHSAFRSLTGAQVNWLRNDLANNTQRWTIVYFHHPPYSKGSHDSDTETELIEMREKIVPILEQYKVDLVLCGHSHSYERSMLMHGHYDVASTFDPLSMAIDAGTGLYPAAYNKTTVSDGTVYAVCGVSGTLGSTSPGWPHPAMIAAENTITGSLVIDVNGDRLDSKFLTGTGAIGDEFTIIKQNASRIAGFNSIQPPSINTFMTETSDHCFRIVTSNTGNENNIVQVFSFNGQLLEEVNFTGSEFKFCPDVKGEGIYILRVTTQGTTASKKFIR